MFPPLIPPTLPENALGLYSCHSVANDSAKNDVGGSVNYECLLCYRFIISICYFSQSLRQQILPVNSPGNSPGEVTPAGE